MISFRPEPWNILRMRVVKTCSSVRELIGKGEILQVIVGHSTQLDYDNIKQIYANK